MRDYGVRIGAMGANRMRAVTHLDVTRSDIEQALTALKAVMASNGS